MIDLCAPSQKEKPVLWLSQDACVAHGVKIVRVSSLGLVFLWARQLLALFVCNWGLRILARMEAKQGYSTLFQNVNNDLLAGVIHSASNMLKCLKWRFVISGIFLKEISAYDIFPYEMTPMLCYFMGVMFFVRLSGNADIGLVNPKGFSRSTRSYVCTCSNLCRTRGHSLPLCWLLHFFSNLLTKGSSGYEWRWIGYLDAYHHMC